MDKSWQNWDPDGPDQASVLSEIARHMRNGWAARESPKSTTFRAGHQLAYKGWKFPGALVDLATGEEVPSIKALRALIIAGRHDWFERAALLAPGPIVTARGEVTDVEARWVGGTLGLSAEFSRISIDDAEIWMVLDREGWRVVAVFVRDTETSGVKQALILAKAASGGCLLSGVLAVALAVVVGLVLLREPHLEIEGSGDH